MSIRPNRRFIICEPLTVCDDNIKSLAMVFGAIESAEKGGWVKIEM